jgi:hypothetical protein
MLRAFGVTFIAMAAVGCGDNIGLTARPDARPPGHIDGAVTGDGAPGDGAMPDGTPIVYPMGSLVEVTTSSQVGILLEDFPLASRARLATAFAALPAQYWKDRAKQQIILATYRLVYRELYYPAGDNRDSLPLTQPEEWTITLDPAGPSRMVVDGHDLVVWNYTMATTLLSDEASPGATEPNLAAVGGVHTESFMFPIDPTMLFQRTGYACMDEDEFPPESVDEENAWEYYDDTCKKEGPGSQSCHLTFPLPQDSCDKAVKDAIGRVTVALRFERVAWDATKADAVRRGAVTQQNAPDLSVVVDGYLGLHNNHTIYRYFAPDNCALIEGCVGAAGWRRLITFDSYDHNQGAMPLHIGEVDYAVSGLGSELITHNVYELSACHNHYHFEYYGDFFFGAGMSELNKNGFCLESTGRISNNELSPLHTPYSCDLQGVSPGWGDLYAAGLACNWVDVTGVSTAAGPVTKDLTFSSNPDHFICEGTLKKDSSGNQLWEPTSFVAENGQPVDRPACDQAPGTDVNDLGKVAVTLAQKGGMLTQACTDDQTLGPRRNCGFTASPTLLSCTAGSTVTVSCTGGSTTKPQVVRLCETSRALGTGTDCVHRDARANVVLEGIPTLTTLTCPAARDTTEIGGQLAVYTAPVYAPDGTSAVTCTVL